MPKSRCLPRTAIAVVGLVIPCIAPRWAWAKNSVHGTGSVSIGYSDNISGAPSEPEPGDPERVGDALVTLIPGIVYLHSSETVVFFAAWRHPSNYYLTHPGARVSGDEGDVGLYVDASETDQLLLTLTGTRTTAGQSGFSESEVAAQPGESFTYVGAGLGETWTHQFSEYWSSSQGVSASTVIPVGSDEEDPVRASFGGGLGVSYRWGAFSASLGGDAQASWLPGSETTAPLTNPEPDRLPIIVKGLLTLRGDLSQEWSIDGSGGVVYARDPLVEETYVGPIWGAGVHFAREAWRASLTYRRDINTDLVTARTTLSDTVSLSGGIPISTKHYVGILTTSGVSVNRQISLDETVNDTFYFWIADAAVGWLNPKYPSVLLRYTHLEQLGVDDPSGLLQNFATNTVMATVEWTVPFGRPLMSLKQPQTRVDDADQPIIAPPSQMLPGREQRKDRR